MGRGTVGTAAVAGAGTGAALTTGTSLSTMGATLASTYATVASAMTAATVATIWPVSVFIAIASLTLEAYSHSRTITISNELNTNKHTVYLNNIDFANEVKDSGKNFCADQLFERTLGKGCGIDFAKTHFLKKSKHYTLEYLEPVHHLYIHQGELCILVKPDEVQSNAVDDFEDTLAFYKQALPEIKTKVKKLTTIHDKLLGAPNSQSRSRSRSRSWSQSRSRSRSWSQSRSRSHRESNPF